MKSNLPIRLAETERQRLSLKSVNKLVSEEKQWSISTFWVPICYIHLLWWPLPPNSCGMSHRSVIEEKGKREKALD